VEPEQTYYRKIIHITGEDSPNVLYAQAEIKAGKNPSHRSIIPGVLSWREFNKRLLTWDEIRKTIGLFGRFYKGKEVLLYPPDWLDRAARIAKEVRERHPKRTADGIGVDPAEGGDKTAWAAVDRYGIIEIIAKETPDTSVIVGDTLAFMQRHGITKDRAGSVIFDRGGGGKQRADDLRAMGWNVRTVAFGEPVIDEDGKQGKTKDDKRDQKEQRYVFRNRRAQLYGEFRELLDPSNEEGFGVPGGILELRKQLSPIPLLYDKEGRMILPPKRKKNNNTGIPSLEEIIGHSPDEADATVLAIHAMLHKPVVQKVGAAWRR
jgi:hypothetical protein